jgi:anti-sigma regulatory factor (Ser/Thr protein kinase)
MRSPDLRTFSGGNGAELPVTRPPLRSVPNPHPANPLRGGATIRLQLDCGPSAAAEARAAVGLLEGRAHPDALDDVRLLVSEVVTNAVRHSGSPDGTLIDLEISAHGESVRVEVVDGGRGFTPRARTAGQSRASGWGLHLVDRLAQRWGVERTPRPRVWFELGPAV